MYAFEFKICASGVMKAAVQSQSFCSFRICLVKCGIDLGWCSFFLTLHKVLLLKTYLSIYIHTYSYFSSLDLYFLLKQYKLSAGKKKRYLNKSVEMQQKLV